MRSLLAAALLAAATNVLAAPYTAHHIPRGPYHLYARDYAGAEPPIVLMHGFPDDLHLYDRLVPELRGRRRIVFDFLGWGRSDKPVGYPYTATNQIGEPELVHDGTDLEIGRASCRERV